MSAFAGDPQVTAPTKDVTLAQLEEYYNEVTEGGIKVNPTVSLELRKTAPSISFDLMTTWIGKLFAKEEYKAKPALDRAILQNLFYVDVDAYNKKFGGRDFLESKRIQNRDLAYDYKLSQYQQPYPSLESWSTMVHPPIRKLSLPIEKYNRAFAPVDRRTIQSPYFTKKFQKELDDTTGTELTQGNRLNYLPNNTAYYEKLRLIHNSSHSIWLASMAIDCSDSTMELLQAMKEKMNQGVDVKILTEYLYAIILPGTASCYRKMKRMGLPITLVNDHTGWGMGQRSSFFHDKIWVFDEKTVIIGGQNIIEMNNNSDGFNKHFRDGDVEVAGPAVTDYREEYLKVMEQYNYVTSASEDLTKIKAEITQQKSKERLEGVRGVEHYEDWFSNPDKRLSGVCRTIVQKAYGSEQSHADVFSKYLESAQESVWLSTPKLENRKNREGSMVPLLEDAAERGIDVHVLSNGIDGGDAGFTITVEEFVRKERAKGHWRAAAWLDSFRKWDQKRSARFKTKPLVILAQKDHFNVSLYFQYIHEKKWQFDRLAVYIGSYNLDGPSTFSNQEAGIICMDENLLDQVEYQTTLDEVNSTPLVINPISETD